MNKGWLMCRIWKLIALNYPENKGRIGDARLYRKRSMDGLVELSETNENASAVYRVNVEK